MNLNLGTQDKKKTLIAAGLGGFAVLYLAWQLYSNFGGSTPPPPTTTTVTTDTTTVTPGASRSVSTTNAVVSHGSVSAQALAGAARQGQAANAEAAGAQSQNPALRFDLIALSEHTVYAGTGRNVFSTAPPPAPALEAVNAPIRPVAPVDTTPAGPAPPPPIDLQFYGFATSKGQKKRVFLKHGDDIFIASEGDIVNHRYRVKQVNGTSVVIEDILNNNTQPLPLSMQIAG